MLAFAPLAARLYRIALSDCEDFISATDSSPYCSTCNLTTKNGIELARSIPLFVVKLHVEQYGELSVAEMKSSQSDKVIR